MLQPSFTYLCDKMFPCAIKGITKVHFIRLLAVILYEVSEYPWIFYEIPRIFQINFEQYNVQSKNNHVDMILDNFKIIVNLIKL